MDPLQFCYWLQGWIELGDIKEVTPEQVNIIKEHLALVLTKVTGTGKLSGIMSEVDCMSDEVVCSPAKQVPFDEEEMKKLIEEFKQESKIIKKKIGFPKTYC